MQCWNKHIRILLQEKEAALSETETALREKQKSDRALEDKSQILARIESQLTALVQQQTILDIRTASSREAQAAVRTKT